MCCMQCIILSIRKETGMMSCPGKWSELESLKSNQINELRKTNLPRSLSLRWNLGFWKWDKITRETNIYFLFPFLGQDSWPKLFEGERIYLSSWVEGLVSLLSWKAGWQTRVEGNRTHCAHRQLASPSPCLIQSRTPVHRMALPAQSELSFLEPPS